ncbi:MAG TPA: DUF4097 family beta strand repeat-containing protein [Rhodanobacter sp.]|jgi:hypothetical protein|nr:DUF4097 family beta strand repeat-containing protein [Rhodanobacter sp.]
MRRIFIAFVLSAPFAAFAAGSCKFEAPRNLQADLAGVRSVQIDVNSRDLHLIGGAGANGLNLVGRACASEQAALDRLTVTQQREGDQLLIDIGGNRGGSGFNLFGDSQTSIDVTVNLPATMPVTVRVGSGDADVRGVQELRSTVGSGDLHVHQVAGQFATSVGSGDVEASDIGSLRLGSVGSGDFKADGIKGDASIGSIGSGDATLGNVGGSVHADTLGSGDLTVRNVAGDFSLGAKGSGDVDHSGVKGKVSVPHRDN